MTETTLEVSGMSCDGCEQAVTDALEELPGLPEAEADHETGRVWVRHNPTTAPTEDLADAIEDAGYEVAE